VDTSRISFGEMIAAASGVALIIFMFLPWYGASVEAGGFSASENASAWEAMSFIDILLFLIALAAIGAAAARAAGAMPSDLPAPPGQIIFILGVVAVVLVLFRLIDIPEPDVPAIAEDAVDFSRKVGVFLSLIAAGGIAYGGYAAREERASGQAPPAAPPPAAPAA
jgi:hypothetical protein